VYNRDVCSGIMKHPIISSVRAGLPPNLNFVLPRDKFYPVFALLLCVSHFNFSCRLSDTRVLLWNAWLAKCLNYFFHPIGTPIVHYEQYLGMLLGVLHIQLDNSQLVGICGEINHVGLQEEDDASQ